MAVLKRIGPGSVFKVGALIYAILGAVIGVLVWAASALTGSLRAGTSSMLWATSLGFAAVPVFAIIYGVVGGIFLAIGALIYNLIAGWVGGISVEIN